MRWIFKLGKRKEYVDYVGLKIQSTVYPENEQKVWYGSQSTRKQLTSIFEKL